MSNIVVVTGSVRPQSVNSKVVPLVVAELEKTGVEVTIADLGALDLPFFDAPVPTSSPDFKPEHDSVRQWTQLVDTADGVVLVTPEYNHTLSPVQLNAIDWIGKEWQGKPVALVGYGWRTGGAKAHEAAREALIVNLKADVGETSTNLFFMKDLNPEGSLLDATAVTHQINATLDELLEKISVAVAV